MKQSLTEKQAKAACDNIVASHSTSHILVEWRKSKVYGANPVITYRDKKCSDVTGCGYDKLSTALARFFKFLFPYESDDYYFIAGLGEGGVDVLLRELLKRGWVAEAISGTDRIFMYSVVRLGQ